MQNLKSLLNGKPLFYKEMDYERMPCAWKKICSDIKPFKIVHVIGTNGKGSTGRFLAQILHLNGKSVGHYTSPHIFEFNERFWLNGKVASDEILQKAHERLLEILPQEFVFKTSYFEYATLLAAVLFEECEYFICEAGIGGEFDATNVFNKRLSLFTPIGFDHVGVLGSSIEEIARTKFNAISKSGEAIMNDTMQPICAKIANDIAAEKDAKLSYANEILDKNDYENLKAYEKKFALPEFLYSNLNLAAAAAKKILGKLDISNLKALDLSGRCEQIAPNVFIDVGHNELGAQAIARKFKDEKLVLIYNSFFDKDYRAVLKALKPIIKRVEVFEYPSDGRELATNEIKHTLDELGFERKEFGGVKFDQGEKYLAFGSFYLVEAFLREFYASKGL